MTSEPIVDADLVDDESTDLTLRPEGGNLFRSDDPVEIVEQATRVANALKGVVESRGLITMIKGREHPRVEAWQTLGSMLGVAPIPIAVVALPWPDPIPEKLVELHARGLEFGYEASYLAQRLDGTVVGGGTSSCKRSEGTWRDRDDFSLASMSQTRAISKALKGPLGFVMSLAGYETTPAEEMPAESLGLKFGPQTVRAAEGSKALIGLVGPVVAERVWGELKGEFGYMPECVVSVLLRVAP